MKFREFVNLIDDKIDYLFRRGKNADERCYDYFIRTVTFFVVVLIVLCYASFVNAAENFGTFFGGVQYDYFLDFEDVYNHYLQYDRQNTYFAMPDTGIGFIMSNPYSIGPFTTDESFNNIVNFVDTNYTITGNEEYQYSYTVLKRRDNWSNSGNSEFTITKFYSNSECFIVCNATSASSSAPTYLVTNMDSSDMYIRTFSLNYISNSSYHVNFNSESTSNSYTLVQNGQGALYFCDMPLYHMFYSNDGREGDYTYKTVDSMISGIRFGDVTIQLNPYLDVLEPQEPEPEAESNANHMYFNSVKMGLTAQGENNNLSSSSLVIGCEVDNYIKNHIDDYKVYVSCQLNYKDSIYTRNATFGEILPLSLFYNQAYVKGLSEIFSNMPWESPYASFYAYYRHLNDSYNLFTRNEAGKNGRLEVPTLTDIKEYIIGVFKTDINRANIPNDYSISTFQLDISVVLTDSDTFDNKSGVFTQRFDFINGNTSIIKAEGLVNNNPWEGESTPQLDPFPNGSSSSNGGVVQNNNQTVTINNNNNWSNIVNGVGDEQTDASRNLLDAMKNIKESFASMTSESDVTMGFIPFLGESLSSFPGINYIVWSIVIIFSLLVIVFLIKAIFL